MTHSTITNLCRRLAVCGLIISGLCVGLPLRGSAETLSQYKNKLTSISQALDLALRQEHAHLDLSKKTVEAIYLNVPSKMRVSMPNGKVITANFTQLRTTLQEITSAKGKQRSAKITDLSKTVQAIQNAANSGSSVTPALKQNANIKLKKILEQSQFQQSALEKFWQRVQDKIQDFLSGLSLPSELADVFGYIVLAIIIIAFIALLGYLVLRLTAYYSVRAPRRSIIEQQQFIRSAVPSVQNIVEAAEQQAAEGQHREAFRNIYLAAILTLHKADLIHYADGVTNWEYLRSLSRQQKNQATEVFSGMTTSFDELIYGERHVSENDYQAIVQRFRSLEEVL